MGVDLTPLFYPVPASILLRSCMPNPFVASTEISFLVGSTFVGSLRSPANSRSGGGGSGAPGDETSSQNAATQKSSTRNASPRNATRSTPGSSSGSAARVSLRIFDVNSRLVRTLFEGELFPGAYGVNWNGTNERGREAPSGVYFIRLEGNGEAELRE